ncbi:type II toxin-antitoxin system VapC family toxin [Pseudolysinimonas yzui]|uniref:Ribonuclease VapC n=1 Tax=Pseudolysinimonas yzui TaxID=2708254 RepID=A0A8J3GRH4_9MICO|nr:type II toxin-antitoxin system VapC family toxin [Pseudolysinimonas yzui]GHF18289.1 ribonuclease VapC [Pseudolysinimonas yzui]
MIVLDTNVISEVFRPRPDAKVVAWLESLSGEVAITAVTLAELLAGVRRLPDGQRRSALAARIDAAIRPYRQSRAVLAFDDDAADHYADILAAREQAGLPISTADALIAAICRSHDAVCATRNTKDFAGTGIELVDPWAG